MEKELLDILRACPSKLVVSDSGLVQSSDSVIII